jgi:hypothetical protein
MYGVTTRFLTILAALCDRVLAPKVPTIHDNAKAVRLLVTPGTQLNRAWTVPPDGSVICTTPLAPG